MGVYEMQADVDVLVVGAGACGLIAAIAACDDGAHAAIIEAADAPGGNTALSSGSLPAAGTRFQRVLGIDDSAELFRDDLCRQGETHDAMHLVDSLSARSADLLEWLVDAVGVRLDLMQDYRHVGHSVARLHVPPSNRGDELIGDLSRAVEEREIPVALRSRLISLCGPAPFTARIGCDRDETVAVTAASVVLACNGFAADAELRHRYLPAGTSLDNFGSRYSAGDALRIGAQFGAALGNMGAYQGHAAVAARSRALVTWTVIEHGGIIVGPNGYRLGDETIGYSAFAEVLAAQHGPFHLVFDERIAEKVTAKQPTFGEVLEAEGCHTAFCAESLARYCRVPAGALGETLHRTRVAAGLSAEDIHGRSNWGFGALGEQLFAIRIEPALFHTQGGLMVDENARVLRSDGSIIEGLYAGGGAAVGISGRSGAGGYVSGNGLLSACGLGRAAGQHAAARTIAIGLARAS